MTHRHYDDTLDTTSRVMVSYSRAQRIQLGATVTLHPAGCIQTRARRIQPDARVTHASANRI